MVPGSASRPLRCSIGRTPDSTSIIPSGSSPTTPVASCSSRATPHARPFRCSACTTTLANAAFASSPIKSEGPTAGAHDFDALEFLARLLTHVPGHHEICVRYYSAYSVRRRARWRKFGILDDTRMRTDDASQDDTPSWPEIQARRRRWAELLRRIFEVDPLRCPRCGGNMSIVAFVLEQHAIDAILKHLRRTRHDPARLTEHDDLLARPPP